MVELTDRIDRFLVERNAVQLPTTESIASC